MRLYLTLLPLQFRSPEEYEYKPQTEKVDIYSMGNIFYYILSKEWPFERMKSEEGQKRIIAGERPKLSKEIQSSKDPAILAVINAMNHCWIHDPAKRATASEINKLLESQLRQMEDFYEDLLMPSKR